MKRKMNGKGLLCGSVLVFAVLILAVACTSTPKRLLDLITYTEVIEVPGLTQQEGLRKVKTFFNNSFKGNLSNSAILDEDQSSGIISGKLVVDGIADGSYKYRYNSVFSVEIIDETCKITFNEPTIQNIGYVTQELKEATFLAYLTGKRTADQVRLNAGNEAYSKAENEAQRNVARELFIIPANKELSKTDAEIRAEWEAQGNNNKSSTNPGGETQVMNKKQVENLRGPWLKLTDDLKNLLLPQIDQ